MLGYLCAYERKTLDNKETRFRAIRSRNTDIIYFGYNNRMRTTNNVQRTHKIYRLIYRMRLFIFAYVQNIEAHNEWQSKDCVRFSLALSFCQTKNQTGYEKNDV